MLIVLDTNIVAENWAFDKSYHRAFIDYISTVNCEVVFPQIVWSEIRAIYLSHLQDALNKLATAKRNVSKHFVNDFIPAEYYEQDYVNLEKAYGKYSEDLLKMLQCGEHSITEYPSNILPILAEKAIARMKPFSNSGEEFRDAILWHSVLELANEYTDLSPVIFISKNTNEFADSLNKKALHPELQYEVEQLKDGQILYYSSMEEFIKAHKAPIEHIDVSWIKSQISELKLNDLVLEYIRARKARVISYFERKYRNIMLDLEFEKNSIELGVDGLSYYSREEIIYTYKNGDSSLFVNFTGTIIYHTGYFPVPSEVSISKFDGLNHRVVSVNNFSMQYTKLSHKFDAQIEFILRDNKLISSGVVSLDMLERYGNTTYRPSAPIDFTDDNDLPF